MTRHSPEYLKISQGLFDQFINDKLLGRQRNIFLPGMLVTVCPASMITSILRHNIWQSITKRIHGDTATADNGRIQPITFLKVCQDTYGVRTRRFR